MSGEQARTGAWGRIPLVIRAIVAGLLVGMIAAKV